MDERKPNVSIQWRERTIRVYLDPTLADAAFDLGKAIAEVADTAETKEQLRRALTRLVLSTETFSS